MLGASCAAANLGWLQLGRKLRNSTTGESGDPRTDPWPLVYSPLPVTLVFISCPSVVALGATYVRQRRRRELRALLVTYNLARVALASYMFYEVRRQDWLLDPGRAGIQSVVGNVLVEGKAPTAVPCAAQQMARVCWWFFCSKVVELLDTVFLILCKKQEQGTFLIVYHHGSMLFSWWSGSNTCLEDKPSLLGCSFVHIFMYGYYALASLGLRMRRHLWWKHNLTILQLCQFVAIAAHSSYSLFPEHPFPDGFNTAVFLYILALFPHFYCRACIRGKQEKLTSRKSKRTVSTV